MSKKNKLVVAGFTVLVVLIGVYEFLSNHNIAVLNPKGTIAHQERDLIITATALMSLIVVPVLIMTFVIAWKYRAGNKAAIYRPEWDHNTPAEIAWWAIPSLVILVLSIMTWNSSHNLDPFKPLAAEAHPLTIQVVAIQWRWLFIYPEQDIATVNYVQFPKNTPINFEITSDAPMNSFWIPQLGGQIYAMAGMNTKLHLMADQNGEYTGSSANLSGRGFAGMKFIARSSSGSDFDNWIQEVRSSTENLNLATYNQLAQPSTDKSIIYYASVEDGLYADVLMKYMQPGSHLQNSAYGFRSGGN